MVKRILSAIWRALPGRARRTIVRATESHFTVAMAAVVRDREGRVLLLDHVFRPGSGWGLPGGFLAAREQLEDGVRRELREEVGLELDGLELAFARALVFTNQVEIVYRATARGEPRPRGIEISGCAWFSPDALPDGLSGDQRRVIARALDISPRID
jgi:ADP-ribose pyrophosphatase YjhB (NUDIX family)